MIQCCDCEYFERAADGSPNLKCDPYSNVKEPECLVKWQLHQLATIAKSHRATLDLYRRLAPLQEKMFRHMEREIEETEEADRWKREGGDDLDDEPGDPLRF